MKDEESFIQEFEKLNEETKQKINKYSNTIYENKISDGKKELLHDIIKDLKNQRSSLERYFQKELFILGPLSPMSLFYKNLAIKENIPVDYLTWYVWREKQVKLNYLLRAKYCWIIWNLDYSNHKYARKFIRYSKYIIGIYMYNNWISRKHYLTTHFIINCIESSLNCAHILRDGITNEKVIDFSLKLLNFISDTYLIITYRVSEAILEDLKHYDQKYTNNLVSFLIKLCKKYSLDIRNYDTTEAIIQILIKIFKSDNVRVKALKKRIAQLYMENASHFSGLQSYMAYEDAALMFQEIGEHKEKEKALKLLGKINPLDYMVKLEFTFDLTSLKQEIDIRTKEFIDQHKIIEDIFDMIEIPLIKSILKSKSDQVAITDLFHTIVFSSGSATEIKQEDIEMGKKKIYDFYQVYVNSYLLCKNKFYNALITEGILTLEKLKEFFNENGLDNDLSLLLLDGFKYFISNEYHAALFILIPQLETFTKRIADKVGIPVIKKVLEGIQDKTLGDFLLDEDFKNIIGDDLNTYLLWFLADKTGLNLRNKVAHGLIKYKDVQCHIIVGIIEIIFTLIKKLKII